MGEQAWLVSERSSKQQTGIDKRSERGVRVVRTRRSITSGSVLVQTLCDGASMGFVGGGSVSISAVAWRDTRAWCHWCV
jgi:hypothetical protein